MAPTNARKTALCGLFCGLSVVVLSLGSVLPLAPFVLPHCRVVYLSHWCRIWLKNRAAFLLVSSLLSAFFCPDREAMCIFVFLLGIIHLLSLVGQAQKQTYTTIDKNTTLQWVFGHLLWNFMLLVGAPTLRKELADAGIILLFATILLGNIAFLVYDKALVNLFRVYLCQFRPKIFPHSPR